MIGKRCDQCGVLFYASGRKEGLCIPCDRKRLRFVGAVFAVALFAFGLWAGTSLVGCAATPTPSGCYHKAAQIKPGYPMRCWNVCPTGGGKAEVRPAPMARCKPP